MSAFVASNRNRTARDLRGWVMSCAAVVVGVSAILAQSPAAAQAAPAAAAEAAVPVLDRAQIDALLASPDKVLVLDVRRADEVSTIGGFPAFLNVQAADLEKLLPYVPRDRQIVTVSNHAGRAKRAAALLTSRGFQVAGAAGAQDYEAQGGHLVGKKPVAAAAAAH